jgi:hypothetical protein
MNFPAIPATLMWCLLAFFVLCGCQQSARAAGSEVTSENILFEKCAALVKGGDDARDLSKNDEVSGSKLRTGVPPVDPQSSQYLEMISTPSRPVMGLSQARFRLWGKLQYAELPDWDPSMNLHQINSCWMQVAGKSVKINNSTGTKSEVLLPEVDKVERIEFLLLMKNASGVVSRRLLVDVHPRSK